MYYVLNYFFVILARKVSEDAIKTQESEFKAWGVMGDWENKYLSSSPEYIKNELRCFQNLYDRVSIRK